MRIKLKELIQNPFTLFLFIWGILNLVQARFTPLNNDEAYYWMYSKYLAWGYFDHPPMIALMIKLGYYLFHNELGVRLVVVLTQLITLIVIWQTIDKEQRANRGNILLFFMIVAILPVYNMFGFIATPDSPLILFTAAFLLVYKRFLKEETWQNTIFLGLSIAALMYSKYHSALLIILVILSNPGLLKKIRFYIAAIISFLLFFPHLFWQYSNGFPSIKYHLVERVSTFNFAHVPEYLASQFFYNNPFILVLLVWIMIKVKAKNLFDKALYWLIAGFLIFFFISSFRYRVEPQWTALISVPMIIILLNNIDFKPSVRSYIKWTAIVLFPLFLLGRSACMIDYLPVSFFKNEFHKKKQWVRYISNIADNRPVVFTNSYQRAAVYTFYTGEFAYTLDNIYYRKTQYDIWNFEEQVHGKEVLYVPHFSITNNNNQQLTRYVLPDGDSIFTKVFQNFQSLQRECVILADDQYTFSRTGVNTIHLKIFNPYPYIIDFRNKELPVVFEIAFFKKGILQTTKKLDLPAEITGLKVGETITVDCQFTLEDLPPGNYKMAICSETGILYITNNNSFRTARIND